MPSSGAGGRRSCGAISSTSLSAPSAQPCGKGHTQTATRSHALATRSHSVGTPAMNTAASGNPETRLFNSREPICPCTVPRTLLRAVCLCAHELPRVRLGSATLVQAERPQRAQAAERQGPAGLQGRRLGPVQGARRGAAAAQASGLRARSRHRLGRLRRWARVVWVGALWANY